MQKIYILKNMRRIQINEKCNYFKKCKKGREQKNAKRKKKERMPKV